jgi:endonuclease YncB( thermonuclease family)
VDTRKVIIDNVDVNLVQIDSGFAWHYVKYASEQTIQDRELYSKAEAKARSRRTGLWADSSPIPPWDFRRKSK